MESMEQENVSIWSNLILFIQFNSIFLVQFKRDHNLIFNLILILID